MNHSHNLRVSVNNGRRVLIIDDSRIERVTLAAVLRKKGYAVTVLEDGQRCLETIRLKSPDLVLMDVLMPMHHGNQLLHEIRRHYSSLELPVLMTTIKDDSADIIESMALGANAYLVKPLDFGVVLSKIDAHIRIAKYGLELIRLKELEAVNSLVATYNHELNNPLAIALGSIQRLKKTNEDKVFTHLENALWKMSEIIKKIREVTQKERIEFNELDDRLKLLKIK